MSRTLKLVPLVDPQRFKDAALEPWETLRDFLQAVPALSLKALTEDDMARPMEEFIPRPYEAGPDKALYRPPGLVVGGGVAARPREPYADEREDKTQAPSGTGEAAASEGSEAVGGPHPESLSDEEAVRLAYGPEIESVASFLRAGLSVLVLCDKLVVEHLWRRMAQEAALQGVLLEVGDEADGESPMSMPQSFRQRQLAALKELTKTLKDGDVLVIPHLDLLAGGADSNLPGEAREIIELLYGASQQLLLAFADRALVLSEVLASRFAVRLGITGVPQSITYPKGRTVLLGEALVTQSERDHFQDFDAGALHKNVAGMNPVRLRQALKYAVKERPAGEGVQKLYDAIRAFKAQTSSNFEVPKVTFEQIGGYGRVKQEIGQALRLMAGSFEGLSLDMQRELIPRGFIFHGPPGTGKTLFAKAIASQLNATIQVVSGPEVTDMYVGESERKVREIFAEARRNAPAVLVFDEFDSIAGQRSGGGDGGSRAGNAIVTQILTEMDGFRPDVPMLVIGTTNRIDIIDEALLRPSRFQAIAIGMPDETARRAIAKVHADHFKVPVSDALLDVLAASTDGLNGDEIRSLFRDALVGIKCEDPPLAADARRFGQLVGRLRLAHEQRAAQASRRREALILRPGQRPSPSDDLIDLTPNRNEQEP